MESLEVRGKTVEEATERGLQQLGLGRDQVEVTVVSRGKSGFLGMGAEDAIVRLAALAEVHRETSPAQVAKEALEELIRRMYWIRNELFHKGPPLRILAIEYGNYFHLPNFSLRDLSREILIFGALVESGYAAQRSLYA